LIIFRYNLVDFDSWIR